MLDTTHGYEAKLRAESVARRKRLNVGRVPAPIHENPARSVGILTQPRGSVDASGAETCGAPIEWISAQDYVTPFPTTRRPTNRVRSIARAACLHFGLDLKDIMSDQRVWTICRPRMIAMYLARELTARSLPDIGRQFGGRDHTTCLNAIRRIGDLIKSDPQLAADVEAVKALAIAADPGLGV